MTNKIFSMVDGKRIGIASNEVSPKSWTGLVNIVNYLRSLTCCLRIVADIGQDS